MNIFKPLRYILNIVILITSILGGHSLYSQNSSCLLKRQLLKIQKSQLTEISLFLNNEGWGFDGALKNQQFNYWEYPLNYDVVKWAFKSNYSNNYILLFTKKFKSNIVILQTNEQCFKSLQSEMLDTEPMTVIEENMLTSLYHLNEQTIEFRQYKEDYSDRQYSILLYNQRELSAELSSLKEIQELQYEEQENLKKEYTLILDLAMKAMTNEDYNTAITHYNRAYEISPEEIISDQISICHEKLYNQIVLKGDNLASIDKYKDALNAYSNAINQASKCKNTESKIQGVNMKINEINAKIYQYEGALLFQEKKYEAALEKLKKSLSLKDNKQVKEQIDQTHKILQIRDNRKNVFTYRLIEPSSFEELKNNSLTKLETLIKSEESGKIAFTLNIKFDTLGLNHSTTKISASSLSWVKLESDFQTLLMDKAVQTPTQSGYSLAAADKIDINLAWNTSNSRIYYKPKGITNNFSSEGSEAIRKYLLANDTYGKYKFSITTKSLNGTKFQDVELTNFKTRGPLNSIYSIFIPGLGGIRTSYGTKGAGRIFLIYTGIGVSVLSSILSDAYYSEYVKDPNSISGESNYTNANNLNKASIVAAGISSTVYLYDIIWSLAQGFKNIKKSKNIRLQINSKNTLIQNRNLLMK